MTHNRLVIWIYIGAVLFLIILSYAIGRKTRREPTTVPIQESTDDLKSERPKSPPQVEHPGPFQHKVQSDQSVFMDPNATLPEPAVDIQVTVCEDLAETVTFGLEKPSEDQEKVLKYLTSETWDRNVVLISGMAGTGKSALLREFENRCPEKTIVKLAFMGIAAQNIGGMTIHKFFQFPLTPILRDGSNLKEIVKGTERQQILYSTEIIVIDEISTLRCDLLDGIDLTLKICMGNTLPFGGKKVVLIGDIQQLQPFERERIPEEYLTENWPSLHFFSAHVLSDMSKVRCFLLDTNHRQSGDNMFLTELKRIRSGECSSKINGRRMRPEEEALWLVHSNDRAKVINNNHLQRISTRKHIYKCQIEGRYYRWPEEDTLYPVDPEISIKIGARVLITVNGTGYVNGSRGEVVRIDAKGVFVKLESGPVVVIHPNIWERIEYKFDRDKNKLESKVIGKLIQMPIKLGWAITVHKSQGMTLDLAHAAVGGNGFSHGLVYVALSRVRTLEALTLESEIKERDLDLDQRVLDFELDVIRRSKFNN